MEKCPKCDGKGKIKCACCNGTAERIRYIGSMYYMTKSEICIACNGTGKQQCPLCKGKGQI